MPLVRKEPVSRIEQVKDVIEIIEKLGGWVLVLTDPRVHDILHKILTSLGLGFQSAADVLHQRAEARETPEREQIIELMRLLPHLVKAVDGLLEPAVQQDLVAFVQLDEATQREALNELEARIADRLSRDGDLTGLVPVIVSDAVLRAHLRA